LEVAWVGNRPLLAWSTDKSMTDRILELAGSAVPVYTSNSSATWPLVNEDSREAAEARVGEKTDRDGHRSKVEAHRRHSLLDWGGKILSAAGFDLPDPRPVVGLLLVSNRPDRLSSALTGLAAQEYPRVRLVVGLHGEHDRGQVRAALDENQLEAELLSFDSGRPLGWCLNAAAEASPSDVLAKIDDDDLYGPRYLSEAISAMLYSGADMVGKASTHVYLAGSNETLILNPGKEEQEVDYLPGPTLLMRRSLWEHVRFAHRYQRVDSTFVRGARAVGARLYSTSRFEFIWMRGLGPHTWAADPAHFAAGGVLAWRGFDPSRSLL
jgi:hypothetical protein